MSATLGNSVCVVYNESSVQLYALPFSFRLYLRPLIVTSKSSIPHHSFSLPLSLASRCHDLFSGCLNRLAVIKSHALLMTLSWGKAQVPRGKRDWREKKGEIGCRGWVCCVCVGKQVLIYIMEVQTGSKKRGGNNGERAMARACNGLIGREVHGGDSTRDWQEWQDLETRGQTK